MSIDFPTSPSIDQTYTYLTNAWKWNGNAWEKSAVTETGNIEGNTGEVAFYSGRGSNISGATAFFYDGDKVGIGTSGPTEMLDVRGGITASGSIYSGDNIKVKGGITAEKLNIGDDGARFTGTVIAEETIKAEEILITNSGADTLNRWTNSTGLTIVNGITAGGGIYAAGGATFGGMGVDVTGGLTADVLQVSGETVFNGTVTAISAGDVALNLVADSDNSGENDNPIISMGQDGALARFDLGIVGDAGQIFTNSLSNAAFLDTANSFNDLQFSVAGDAKMTILDSGNVGIGTNAPAKTLDVRGGITASNIYIAGGSTFGSNVNVVGGITSDTLQVVSGATFGGTVHFDEDTRFHGNLILNEDGQIKVDGDSETIKLNFGGGILDISANNVDIAKKLRHRGDDDTYLEFTPDTIKLYAGNTNNIILTASETNFSDTEVTRPKLKDYSETALATSTKSASFNVDFENGNVQSFTFSDDLTVSFTNPPATGTAGTVTLIITNGGANTTTWHSNVYWPGNVAPSLTSSGVDIVSFVTIDAGTKIYGFVGGLNFLNS